MDFRRPGRPLVFGPDILNHAVVGLRPGLKQSNPWPGSEGKRAPLHPLHLATSTPPRAGSPSGPPSKAVPAGIESMGFPRV